MPAAIFAPPASITKPDLSALIREPGGIGAYNQACDAYITAVKAWALKNTQTPKSDLVGFVYRYGVADGYAQYVVLDTKPLRLIHLPLGDAWDIPDIVRRGLCLKDIKQAKVRSDAWNKLAAEQKAKREEAKT